MNLQEFSIGRAVNRLETHPFHKDSPKTIDNVTEEIRERIGPDLRQSHAQNMIDRLTRLRIAAVTSL